MNSNVTFEVEVTGIKYVDTAYPDGTAPSLPTRGIFQVNRNQYLKNPNAAVAAAINLQTGVPVKNFRIAG